MSHERFTFVLRSSHMATARVRQLNFRRADGVPFNYIPGQFITLHMPWQDMELRRPQRRTRQARGGHDLLGGQLGAEIPEHRPVGPADLGHAVRAEDAALAAPGGLASVAEPGGSGASFGRSMAGC